MTSTAQPPRLSFLSSLLLAGLIFCVAAATLLAQFQFQRTPSDEDWQLAAEKTLAISEATDGIRVHPSWAESPLPHLRPVGNLLHRHHDPLLEDFLGIQRVLVLTEANRREEALKRLPFDASPEQVHVFGAIELLEVTIPESMRLDFDLTEALYDAEVAYESSDNRHSPCVRSRGDEVVWRCDGRGAQVRSVLKEVENDPRRCIQAYPPSDGRVLAVEMTVEEPSDILRIRAGLDNRAARLEGGDDILYRIYVDDASIADERIDGHTSTWIAHDVPTSERDGAPVELRMEVESVATDPHHRRFCFNGWTMTGEQAGVEISED